MGVFPSNFFSISTRRASASFERWLDRLPFVSPVMFSRKRKSALSHAESATRMARRAGSWTRRLSDCRYSNGVGMIGLTLRSHPQLHDPLEHHGDRQCTKQGEKRTRGR